jgi:DNA-directed RNA polymerase subunit RPC12/RpoP
MIGLIRPPLVEPLMSDIPKKHRRCWNHEKNGHLDIDELSSGSGKRASWKCLDCAHEWENTIANQCNRDISCPFCSGRALHSDGRNSVERIHPIHARFWNSKKNSGRKPNEFTSGSSFNADWKCDLCQNEWKADINNQLKHDEPCPYCRNPRSLHSNGVNSIEHDHPDIARDWDSSNSKKPSEVLPGSKYRAKFICQLEMFGKTCLHKWESRVATRCLVQKGRSKPSGCPAHAGKEVNNHDQRNALQCTHPEVAEELDDEKNPPRINGMTITAGCNEMLWWRCRDCSTEFQAQVSSRTQGEKGRRICSVCRNREVHSDGRNSLRHTHPHLSADWDEDNNGDITPDNVVAGSTKDVHWRCSQQTNSGEVCNYRWKQSLYSRTQMIQNPELPARPCPMCNPGGGYKPHVVGYFYVLRLMDSSGNVMSYKNGITNHPRLRMLRLSNSLRNHRPEFHYELDEIQRHENGEVPSELEKDVKKNNAQRMSPEPFDGGTELFRSNMLEHSRNAGADFNGWDDVTSTMSDELNEALNREKE